MMPCEEAMSEAVLDSPRLMGSTSPGSMIFTAVFCPRMPECLPQHFRLSSSKMAQKALNEA